MKKLSIIFAIFTGMIFLRPQSAGAITATFTSIRNLSFGSITGTTTFRYNNANAAEFEISFSGFTTNTSVTLTFILPADLTDGYGDNLPMTFSTTTSARYNTTNSTTGATRFNPAAGVTVTVTTAHPNLWVFLGGTVTPGANYTVGTYTGTVNVSVNVSGSTGLSIPVTATLTGTVSLSAAGALNFGAVVAGATPAPSLSAQTNTSAPEFTATGTRAASTVTYSSSLSLAGPGTPLTFTPSLFGSSTNTQSGSASIASGAALNKAGNFYFWLGGSLNAIPSGQTPGSYSGTFILRLTY